MSTPVITVGEALVGYATTEPSLRSATSFTRFLGGAELNVAVGLTRLGVPATWASIVGDDAHGDYVRDTVAGLGVTAAVRTEPGPTALMFKAGGADNDPEVLQVRHDSAFAQNAHGLAAAAGPVAQYRHLHLTGIPLGISDSARAVVLELLTAARENGLTVSFDPNLRPRLFTDRMRDTLNAVAAASTVVFPGLAEGRQLTGEPDAESIARFYLDAGAREVVVKLGADGALARTADKAVTAQRFTVRPVDTVGAGDGFAAGYLAGLLTGANLQERVDVAAAVGALVTTRRGDLAAMPTADEVSRFRLTPAS